MARLRKGYTPVLPPEAAPMEQTALGALNDARRQHRIRPQGAFAVAYAAVTTRAASASTRSPTRTSGPTGSRTWRSRPPGTDHARGGARGTSRAWRDASPHRSARGCWGHGAAPRGSAVATARAVELGSDMRAGRARDTGGTAAAHGGDGGEPMTHETRTGRTHDGVPWVITLHLTGPLARCCRAWRAARTRRR